MTLSSQADLDTVWSDDYHRRRQELLRPLVTRRLLSEYQKEPVGQHSDELRRVLTYLASFPADNRVLVENDGTGSWYVCRVSTAPSLHAERIEGPYSTDSEAVVAVFRRRVCEVFGVDLRQP